MKKTLARTATLVMMVLGASVAMAAPGHGHGHGYGHGGPHGMGPGYGACQTQHGDVSRVDFVQAYYDSMGKTLTLTDKQQKVWKAYVDARLDAVKQREAWRADHKVPCMDEQTRLERRADKARLNAKLLDKVADKRADLLKVLDPKQKMVLETYEFKHRGPGHKKHCATPKHRGEPCQQADCNVHRGGMGPGPHHGGPMHKDCPPAKPHHPDHKI